MTTIPSIQRNGIRWMVAAYLAATILAGISPGGEPADDAIRVQVLATNATMTDAVDRGNFETFLGHILDEAPVPVIQDGKPLESIEAIRASLERAYVGVAKTERSYTQTEVTILSPSTALLTGTGDVKIHLQDGRDFSSPFAVSLLFVLRDRSWKVLHGHYSVPNRNP